jgi:hypothetical protein
MLSVVPIDLDQVAALAYGTGRRPRPVEPLLAEAARIANLDQWIAEGIFTGWTEALVTRSTTVVVLKTPLPICLWRVIRRHFRRGIYNDHGGVARLAAFCAEVIDYHRNRDPRSSWPQDPDRTTLAATMCLAGTAGDRAVVLSSKRETNDWLKSAALS